METVEKIKKLKGNIDQIQNLFNKLIPLWREKPQTYDKTRYGFVEGDNDGWYKDETITIHFGSWAGTFGDSSVYKQIKLDGDVFRTHFLQYLNQNKQVIMLAISDSIQVEVDSLKDKAILELNGEINKINAS